MVRTEQPPVIAFCVKSGWATTVLLAGPIDAPVVLDAGIVYWTLRVNSRNRKNRSNAAGTLLLID